MEQVGFYLHNVTISGSSTNSTWYMNRTIDGETLAFSIDTNSTGHTFAFASKYYYRGRDVISCTWSSTNCTGNFTSDDWKVTYYSEIIEDSYAITFFYSKRGAEDIILIDWINFSASSYWFGIHSNRTDATLYEKSGRATLPDST
jgi:hypothetical protein